MAQEPQTRREFLKSMGMGTTAILMSNDLFARERMLAERPNIVLIVVDDLGYGDLSSYGATDLRTPNIDALVSSGIRFDNFYANCPVCSPTRASLLTGRYPDMVGVPGVIRTYRSRNFGFLSPEAILLPGILKRAGYRTAIVGKWHLGLESPNIPNERGFDHFHGFLGDMMDDYYSHRRHDINYMRLNKDEIDPTGHATDLFSWWAIDYIKKRARFKRPFFLYLAYNAPHTPIQPPEDWLQKVTTREQNIDEKRAKLVAFIEHLDDGIGKVLDALKDSGLYDNTLVLFTSDNGGQLRVGADNGPLRGGKQDMYEGGIRVPMCAVWPGRIDEGSRSEQVALTMDLFPTICDVAEANYTHGMDGKSILPTLLGESRPQEDRTLFWVRREGWDYGGRAYYAVRRGNWKLMQNTPFEPLRLYDLEKDPREASPLSKDHPAYKKLFSALRNHIIEAGAVPWQKHPAELK